MKKTPEIMHKQEADIRRRNFKEVALGYTEEQALNEAGRCLKCKKPFCVEGCPVNVQIPDFIKLIQEQKYIDAAKIIKETNSLPAVCGRVCPQEDQCEKACILNKKGDPVRIGYLERFVADELEKAGEKVERITPCKKGKVAILGSGPAGLTCAVDIAKEGYEVKIFEAFHDTGGVLRYGIPEFRLPKRIVEKEVDYIKKLGIDIELDCVVGSTVSIEQLREEGYLAFFIGVGAGTPRFMNIPGENLNGVLSANEFLTRINLMKAYDFPNVPTPVRKGKHVAVIGGGNVAMDAARSALRLGAEQVNIIYRRSRNELPARLEEIENAEEEGIKFHFLTNPKKIAGNEKNWITAMECYRMELGEPDESGRRRPVIVPNSEFLLELDTVIVAIGNDANPLLTNKIPGLELNKWGNIIADDKGQTSIPGIFAGGDIVTGAATVIEAMGAGRTAAAAIAEYLKKI